jgi:hypothetical protein
MAFDIFQTRSVRKQSRIAEWHYWNSAYHDKKTTLIFPATFYSPFRVHCSAFSLASSLYCLMSRSRGSLRIREVLTCQSPLHRPAILTVFGLSSGPTGRFRDGTEKPRLFSSTCLPLYYSFFLVWIGENIFKWIVPQNKSSSSFSGFVIMLVILLQV